MNKKKLNKKDFMFKGVNGESLRKNPGDVNGLDFLISKCVDCEIFIFDHMAQIFVDDCVNCKIYLGPIAASIFVRESKDCEITAAASQVRISDSQNISAHVYSNSEPALENSSKIVLGPYNMGYPGIKGHFEQAKLVISEDEDNKWSQVYDFNNREPPNWSILERHLFHNNEFGDVNPVSRHQSYGGDLQGELLVGSREQCGQQGDMMAFDIQTGQQQAQQIMNQQVQQVTNQQQTDNIDYFADLQQTSNQQQDIGQNDQWNVGFQQQNQQQPDVQIDYFQQNNKRIQHEYQLQQKVETQLMEEQRLKQEKRAQAQMELNSWYNELQNKKQQKLQINRQTNQNGSEEYSWKTIVENIDLKSSEYKGSKDVERMKEAILNFNN